VRDFPRLVEAQEIQAGQVKCCWPDFLRGYQRHLHNGAIDQEKIPVSSFTTCHAHLGAFEL
jgi:hypothetical protein